MDMKYLDEIRALARSMRSAGAGELNLRRPDFSVRIVLKPRTEDKDAHAETRIVKATSFGRFRASGTVQGITLPIIGETVQKNQVLGFLQLDGLTFAVRAPKAGTLTQALARNDALVEFDDDLFEITTPGA